MNGIATAIVSGPETDAGPRFSRDGTHVVFERKLNGETGLGQLVVARSDGSDLTVVTPEPMFLTRSLLGEPWPQYDSSPDGRSVFFAWSAKGFANLSIADSAGVHQLDVGMGVYAPSFRPPDGAEILFVGPDFEGRSGSGIFAVDPATGQYRTIVYPSSGAWDYAQAVWSPDGSQIAYIRWGGPGEGLTAHVRIVSADGKVDRELPAPSDAVWDAGPVWSNDGKRLLTLRGYTPLFEDVRPAVIPADGSGLGIEIPYPGVINGGCCADWEWAPDDSSVLVTPSDALGNPQQQVIIDLVAGTTRPAPWTTTSDPTWQRTAP